MILQKPIQPDQISYDASIAPITIIDHRIFQLFIEHTNHTKDFQICYKAWHICTTLTYALLEPDVHPTWDVLQEEFSFKVWIAWQHRRDYGKKMLEVGVFSHRQHEENLRSGAY